MEEGPGNQVIHCRSNAYTSHKYLEWDYRSFSLTWSVAPVGWWNNTKYLNKKELIPVPYTNMAAISLFWYTNMAAVTSDENDL
jgi:hypothetical protein